jgi:hypothetical protein
MKKNALLFVKLRTQARCNVQKLKLSYLNASAFQNRCIIIRFWQYYNEFLASKCYSLVAFDVH